jgi:hypothetical protein
MMGYYRQLNLEGKIKNNTKYTLGMDVRLNHAILGAKRNAGYREEAVLNDIASIEISGHIYPGDKYLTADIFNTEGDGIQIILEHETDRRGGGYKPGDIVG